MTSELRKLIRQRDYLRAKANKTGSEHIRQVFNYLRSMVNYKLNHAKRNYYTCKIEQHKDNLKLTWKVLKHAIGEGGSSISAIENLELGDDIISDSKQISEICNDHFVTVGERLACQIPCSDYSPTVHIPKTNSVFQLKPVTEGQVLKLLNKLINGKATGLHNIPNRVLKESADIIGPSLTFIFNFSIMSRAFPDDLKMTKVTPAFKGGDRDDLGNYRPISVLPTVARIFEKLVYDQMYAYFLNNGLLGDRQFGFRSLHSTALALSKVTNTWLLNLDSGRMSSVVLLDIQKAFDTVDHQILLDKLRCYGVSGDQLVFSASYLNNRQQCCNVNGKISSTKKIRCGVPQGSIMGPLLFIIYMNEGSSRKLISPCMLMILVCLKV